MSVSLSRKFKFPDQVNLQASWIPLAVVMLIAIALRVYQLGAESLWIDEMLSIEDAEVFTWSNPGIRPLYYFLLQQWMAFGSSDVWLRSLAVLFDLGSVILIYQLGQYVLNRTTGTLAALIYSISPIFINHAQEIRMYSLSTFLCLAGTLVLAHGLEQPTPKHIVGWIVLRLLAILTFPLNLMILLADAILLVWRFRDRKRLLMGFGIGLVILGLLWIPFIPILLEALDKFSASWSAGLPPPDPFDIMAKLTNFTTFWPSSALAEPLSLKLAYAVYTVGLTAVLGYGLLNRRRYSNRLVWIIVWAIVPLLPILIKSWVSSSLWVARYLIFTAPYSIILLVHGFLGILNRKKWLGIALAFIYGVAIIGSLGFYYQATYRDNWKAAAAIIERNEQPGDIVGQFADIPRADMGLLRYYEGESPAYFIRHSSANPVEPEKPLSEMTEQERLQWNQMLLERKVDILSSGELPKEADLPDNTQLEDSEIEAALSVQNWPQVDSRLWFVCRDCADTEKRDRILSRIMDQPFEIDQETRVSNGMDYEMPLDVMLVTPKSSP